MQIDKMKGTAVAAAIAAAIWATACGPAAPPIPEPTEPAASTESTQTTADREAELEQREREIAEREAALREEAKPLPAARPASTPATAPSVSRPATTAVTVPAAPAIVERQPVQVEVPAGTQLDLETLSDLSSGTSQVGDRFRARVVTDVMAGNVLAIPAGTPVDGTVTEVVPLKKFGGKPQIALAFDAVELPGGASVPIRASMRDEGKKQTGRDAAKIGAGAAAGAVLGHQVDDDNGKLIGAVIGGAVGTAVAAKTGKEIELPAGTVVSVAIEESIRVPVIR